MRKYVLAFTLLTTTTALFADSLVQQVMKEMKPIPVVGKYKHYLKPYAMMSKKVTYAQMKQFFEKKHVLIKDKMQRSTYTSTLAEFNGNYAATATFNQAQAFCQYIGQQTSKNITLPTERQWVYAAMAGPKRYKYPTNNGKIEPGSNIPSQKQVGNDLNSFKVDQFPPNPFGMYAMSGDGQEWTNTSFVNPALKGQYYVIKGSPLSDIWQNDYSSSTVTSSTFGKQASYSIATFRCVENLEKSAKNKTTK